MKTKLKSILALIIIFQLTLFNPLTVSAFGLPGMPSLSGIPGGPSMPDTPDIASQIRKGINDYLENDLNINVQDSLKPMTESINTMDRKGQIPEVSLRFSTQNPKPGEAITVNADVQNLANVNDAYYTWFLKRDGDNYDDIDKLHKNAIRAQVAMYYDPETQNQRFNQGGDAKEDNDSYTARMGGGNGIPRENSSKADYCYIYDVETGEQYEIGKGSDKKGNGCEEGYVARCMQETRELICPVDVPEISGETSSSTSSVDNTATAEASTTISGGGGPRDEVIVQCLDSGISPTCDPNTQTLNCATSDAGNMFNSDSWYACDGTSCDTYDENGHCCEEYKSLKNCERDNKGKEDKCKKGLDMRAVSYDYDAPAISPTPFCLKINSTTGKEWTDPHSGGCGSDSEEENEECPANCSATINGTVTEECSVVADGKPHFRFPKPGPEYCAPGASCEVEIDCGGTTESYSFSGPDPEGTCPTNPGDPGRYEDGEFLWKGKSESNCNLVILGSSSLMKNAADFSVTPIDSHNNTQRNPASTFGGCSDTGYAMTVTDGNVGEWSLHFDQSLIPDVDSGGTIFMRYLAKDGQYYERAMDYLIDTKDHVTRDLAYVMEGDPEPAGDWNEIQCSGKTYWAPSDGEEVQYRLCSPSGGTALADYTFEVDMEDFYKSKGCTSVNGCTIDDDIKMKPGKCKVSTPDKNSCGKKQHVFPQELGQGEFTTELENEYGTNPKDERTTPLASNDAALAVGLGVKAFTWKYQPGDEITVVVEGMGTLATKHEDATYQTVFAMPKGGCKAALDKASKNSYQETVKKKTVEIQVADIDTRDCIIPEIFEKPGTSEYDSLNVNVSHASRAASASAVPSGLSQPMHITAQAGQIQGGEISNSQQLYYEWDVLCGGENVTNDIEGISKTKGMNLPSLDFTANFPQKCVDEGEVTVTTKINEPRRGGGSNFGQSETTFEIYDVKESPLKVYKTQVTDTTKFQKTGDPICNEGIDRTVCRVMNNEVIAITATKEENGQLVDYEDGMLSWSVNGKSYSCTGDVSDDCDAKDENGQIIQGMNSETIILPITGNNGDTITVTANMNDVTYNKNNSQSITRVFKITDPEISIEPVEGAVRKVLGTYEDLDDNKYIDESNNILETIEGTTVVLGANFYPQFLNNQEANYEWYINGEMYGTGKTIQFTPEDNAIVFVETTMEMDMEERWAQNQSFNKGLADTSMQKFTSSVQINVNQNPELTQSGIKGFFATTAHNAPEYFIFLLKMTFTMGIMLFIPMIILGMGEMRKEK